MDEKQFINEQAKAGRDAKKVQTMQTKLENREKLQEKLLRDKENGQDDLFAVYEKSKQTKLF